MNCQFFPSTEFRYCTGLSPVIFLKKRLKEDWSSNPRMSAISFELLLLYKRSRLASASTRSWMTRRGDGNLQEEKMFERVLGDLCKSEQRFFVRIHFSLSLFSSIYIRIFLLANSVECLINRYSTEFVPSLYQIYTEVSISKKYIKEF